MSNNNIHTKNMKLNYFRIDFQTNIVEYNMTGKIINTNDNPNARLALADAPSKVSNTNKAKKIGGSGRRVITATCINSANP